MPNSTPHLDRKALKAPDEFVTATRKAFMGLASHTQALIAGMVILALAAVGVAVFISQKDAKAVRARDALYDARQTLDQELEAAVKPLTASSPPAAAGAKAKTPEKPMATPIPKFDPSLYANKKLDVDSKLGGAITKFKGLIDQFPGSRAAYEASLAIGDTYFNHGETEKSVSWYQKSADTAPGAFEAALALSSLGYAQENLGHLSDAASSYDRALKEDIAALKGDLLLALARVDQAQGNKNKAQELYEKILAQLPNTDYAKKAETLKNEIK